MRTPERLSTLSVTEGNAMAAERFGRGGESITDLDRARLGALLADARTERRFATLPWARTGPTGA